VGERHLCVCDSRITEVTCAAAVLGSVPFRVCACVRVCSSCAGAGNIRAVVCNNAILNSYFSPCRCRRSSRTVAERKKEREREKAAQVHKWANQSAPSGATQTTTKKRRAQQRRDNTAVNSRIFVGLWYVGKTSSLRVVHVCCVRVKHNKSASYRVLSTKIT